MTLADLRARHLKEEHDYLEHLFQAANWSTRAAAKLINTHYSSIFLFCTSERLLNFGQVGIRWILSEIPRKSKETPRRCLLNPL